MIESELDNYYFLYNNLIEENNNYMNNITKSSHKREDIVTQILADKGGFKINNDTSLFYEDRNIVYLKIKVTKNSETDDNIVKESTLIRNVKQFKTTIQLDNNNQKISYEINIKDNNIQIVTENISLSLYRKRIQSDNSIDQSIDSFSSNSGGSNKIPKINNGYEYIFQDTIHNKTKDTYFIIIRQISHEIDGSLIANKAINDLKDIVGNIIYYPRDTPIQIVEGQKVFIEIKQNATLVQTFDQMKRLMEDLYELLPEEKYLYLGIINKENSLACFLNDHKNEKEKKFIQGIKETIEKFKKFNICLLIIENNEFLGFSLEERSDYAIYCYNLISQQIDNKINAVETKINAVETKINAMETKINAMETKIDNKINGIQTEVNTIKNKMNDLDSKMNQILDLIKNNLGTKNNNSSGENSGNKNDGAETGVINDSKNSNDDL